MQLARLRRSAAILAAMLVAGTSLLWAAPVGAQDPVTIQFWQPDTREDWIAARDSVIADFEAANPDIRVEVTPIDWGQLLPKLQSAVASNTAPDVFFLNPPSNVFAAQQAGLLQPVTDVVNALPEGTFEQSLVDNLTFQDEVWALPFATFPHVIWYRMDLFDEAGLAAPSSWADILHAAEVLNDPPDRFGLALYADQPDPHVFVEVLASHGASLLDEDGNIAINSPETAEAVELWKQLWQYTQPDAISKGNLEQRQVFAAGGAAIIPTQISMVTNLTSSDSLVDPEQVAVAPVPNEAGTRPAIINDVLSLTVPSNAPHPDEAKRFLEFWFSPENYLGYISRTVPGHLPTETAAGADDSTYWQQSRIAPVQDLLKTGVESLALGSFFYPGLNECEPRAHAAGLFTEMSAHAVVDGWSGEQVAQWAAEQAANICGL